MIDADNQEDQLPGSISRFVTEGALVSEAPKVAKPRAEHTERHSGAIDAAVARFSLWHQLKLGTALPDPSTSPASETVILDFMLDHLDLDVYAPKLLDESIDLEAANSRQKMLLSQLIEGNRRAVGILAPRTLEAMVRRIHIAYENVDRSAFQSPKIKALRKMLLEDAAGGGTIEPKAQPFVGENLRAILATCESTLTGLRDRAFFLFVLSVGEFGVRGITGVRAEHFDRKADGSYVFDFRAAGLKPRHRKIGLNGLIQGEAAKALDDWLKASGIIRGAVFCATTKQKVLIQVATQETIPLAQASVHALIAQRVAKTELKGVFHWSSFHLSAPIGQANSRAAPRNWRLQDGSGSRPKPQPSVPLEQFVAPPSSPPEPELVLVHLENFRSSTKFAIETLSLELRWGVSVHVATGKPKESLEIGSTVIDGIDLIDLKSEAKISLKGLSKSGLRAVAKFVGLLPRTSSEAERSDAFLRSDAGGLFARWTESVNWKTPTDDPRQKYPDSMFTRCIAMDPRRNEVLEFNNRIWNLGCCRFRGHRPKLFQSLQTVPG
jgi:hypothetical protein